tara:strand:- start:565 stop:942 length:378 start_codon:yes stop_codon:yes gene_type:complete
MKIYNVIAYDRSDCYKRAETWSNTVLTTTNRDAAYNAAANAWLENYIERFDEPDYAPELDSIQLAVEGGSGEVIHDVFDSNKWEIYNPEYINEPTFEVSVEAEELQSEECSLDETLIRAVMFTKE